MFTIINVPVEQIEIGTRMRKNLGEENTIKDLADSIEREGLINPISVKSNPEGSEKAYMLIAGERRLRAMSTILNWTEVPARVWEEPIDELRLRRLELAENLYRKSMEWTEEVEAERLIHNLEGKPATLAETAALVGKGISQVSSDLKLAAAIKVNPSLKTHKNKAEAIKAMHWEEEKLIKEELARRAMMKNKVEDSGSLRAQLSEAYKVGNFFSLIKEIPTGSIDLIEADPPYGIDFTANSLVSKSHDMSAYKEYSVADYTHFLRLAVVELERVLAPNGWLILWYASSTYRETIAAFDNQPNLIVNPSPAIWYKQTKGGRSSAPELMLILNYEPFLVVRRKNSVLCSPGSNAVFECPPATNKVHPAEKPVPLMRNIYKIFTLPGSNILIPFAGSGNGMLAAAELGMRPVGFDISPTYRDNFILRLQEWMPGFDGITTRILADVEL